MPTAKEEVRDLLEKLPDEASLTDIEYEIYVLNEIQLGMADADRGALIDHEDVKARVNATPAHAENAVKTVPQATSFITKSGDHDFMMA